MIRSRTALAIFGSTIVSLASAQESAVAPTELRRTAEQGVALPLSRYIKAEMTAHGLPGLSIAVMSQGELLWSKGFGYADRKKKRPASGSTVYRTASISKLFTSIAVMQLCERGKLSLDRPVREYLPEFRPQNPYGQAITLRHLLSHHSGLQREPVVGHYFEAGDSLAAVVQSLAGKRLVYAPGSRYKYSNAAVSVAGYAVEKSEGKDFRDCIREAILEPLGLLHSSFDAKSAVALACAQGSMWTQDGRSFAAPTFALGMEPATNLYASVEDLVRFASACSFDAPAASRLLSRESLAQVFRLQYERPDGERGRKEEAASAGNGIGLGFFIDEFERELRVSHSGGIYGFSSRLEFLPHAGLAVAVATNLDSADGVIRRIAAASLRSFLSARQGTVLAEVKRPQSIGVERARALAGRYGDAWNWLELRERKGDLHEIPAAGVPTIYRELNGSLVGDGRLTGAWTHRVLRVVENGVERNGRFLPKLSDTCPVSSPRRYREFIGEYGWDHGTLYILEDGGRLCCLVAWFSRCLLAEYGKDRFVMPNDGPYRGEKLEFERDTGGKIVALVVGHQRYPRRSVGPGDGVTFKIEALFPPAKLRAMAREARMPKQKSELRQSDLVDLKSIDGSIQLDVRYATKNNFMDMVFYERAKAMMQRRAAEAVGRVHKKLAARGLGLTIHDAYRPWSVTKMFWDATPKSMKDFVANPAQGSRHNRGCAVDLTLHRLSDGEIVTTVSGYDEFTERAYPDYPGGTSRQRWYRETLRRAMENEGFAVYEWEWWHFDFGAWREYPVLNQPFK